MPPHCDALDGPVVRAARRALDAADVTLVLPFVPREAEAEIVAAFDEVLVARQTGDACRRIADRYFFETVVRVHRAGEGAPYTGLKPAGLDVGPVLPIAERAVETGSGAELTAFLANVLRAEIERRFDHLEHLRHRADGTVDAARAYVGAMLGIEVWANDLHHRMKAEAHAGEHAHGREPRPVAHVPGP